MVVADTDVLITGFDRRREPERARLFALLRRGELATTVINVFELTAGQSTTPSKLEQLHAALGQVTVLPVTQGAAELAAAVSRHLGRRGLNLAPPDLLIAGVCLANGLPLLTRNVEHFGRVPGLVLEQLPG